jgi:hypothetical protein
VWCASRTPHVPLQVCKVRTNSRAHAHTRAFCVCVFACVRACVGAWMRCACVFLWCVCVRVLARVQWCVIRACVCPCVRVHAFGCVMDARARIHRCACRLWQACLAPALPSVNNWAERPNEQRPNFRMMGQVSTHVGQSDSLTHSLTHPTGSVRFSVASAESVAFLCVALISRFRLRCSGG